MFGLNTGNIFRSHDIVWMEKLMDSIKKEQYTAVKLAQQTNLLLDTFPKFCYCNFSVLGGWLCKSSLSQVLLLLIVGFYFLMWLINYSDIHTNKPDERPFHPTISPPTICIRQAVCLFLSSTQACFKSGAHLIFKTEKLSMDHRRVVCRWHHRY